MPPTRPTEPSPAPTSPAEAGRPVPVEPLPRAVRRRAREEIVGSIVEVARRHLATEGASGLSLRAVARELGMVSSAVYRYVASRDELLTLLIIDGYDALGAAAEEAERAVPRADLLARWMAVCHGVRDWALAHPHEYALLYGTPVPGYVAPQDTLPAAIRVTVLLSALLRDAAEADPGIGDQLGADGIAAGLPIDDSAVAAMGPAHPFIPDEIPAELVLRGLTAWTYLFGAVSFEIFGHRQSVIDDDPGLRRAYFVEEMTRIGRMTGLGCRPDPGRP